MRSVPSPEKGECQRPGRYAPRVAWEEHAEREEARYADALARMPDEPDPRQKQLVRAAMAAGGAGLARLMQGRAAEAAGWFARSAERYRASWPDAPPASWGRLIGALKSRILAEDWDGAEADARWALEQDPAEGDSPIGAYAAALARLVLGEDRQAGELVEILRVARGVPGRHPGRRHGHRARGARRAPRHGHGAGVEPSARLAGLDVDREDGVRLEEAPVHERPVVRVGRAELLRQRLRVALGLADVAALSDRHALAARQADGDGETGAVRARGRLGCGRDGGRVDRQLGSQRYGRFSLEEVVLDIVRHLAVRLGERLRSGLGGQRGFRL